MGRNLKIHPKPLDKKEWDFWDERLTNFIMEMEHNVTLTPDEILDRGDKDMFETYLMGIVKGMWSVHKWVEAMMVEKEDNRAQTTEITNKIDKRKRPLSEGHIENIRKGIKRAWKEKRGDKRGKRLSAEGKKSLIRGIKRYWRNKRKSKQPETKIYRELGENRKKRKSETVTADEVFDLLSSMNKRKNVQYNDLLDELRNTGKVPKKKNLQKHKKALFDRLYILQKQGKIKSSKKKGHKRYYTVA